MMLNGLARPVCAPIAMLYLMHLQAHNFHPLPSALLTKFMKAQQHRRRHPRTSTRGWKIALVNSRPSCAKRKTQQQSMIFSTRAFFRPRLGRRNRRVHRNTQYQMAILTTCTQGPETHLAALSASRSKAFPKHQVAPLHMLGGMSSGLTGPQIYLNQSCFAI